MACLGIGKKTPPPKSINFNAEQFLKVTITGPTGKDDLVLVNEMGEFMPGVKKADPMKQDPAQRKSGDN